MRICATAIIFFLAIGASGLSAQQKKLRTVAVIDFTNEQKSTGLAYLSKALPESISASLSNSTDIKIVERRKLAAMLKETELAQLGVTSSEEYQKAGKLAKADVLIVGSFSGKADAIHLSLKAIDVATGTVLDGKSFTAQLGDLFDKSTQAAQAMAAVISGQNLGYLTINTNPQGAEIFIDGFSVGTSPIVEYKLTAGEHRIFITKKGHSEREYPIIIKANDKVKWSANLPDLRKPVQSVIGFSMHRVFSENSDLNASNLYMPMLGLTFGSITGYFEMGFSSQDHSYSFSSPFGGQLTQDRRYVITLWTLGINYEPFDQLTYVSPYLGIFAGYMSATDYRKVQKSAGEVTDETLGENSLFQLGGKMGIEILPKNMFSFFIEGRYLYVPGEVSRVVHESQGLLGGLTARETKISLNSFSIGGGVKFSF